MDYDNLAKENGGTAVANGGDNYDAMATQFGGQSNTPPPDTRNIVQKIAGAFIDPAITLATRPGQMIGNLLAKGSELFMNPDQKAKMEAGIERANSAQPRIPFFGTHVRPINQDTPENVEGNALSTVALGAGNPTLMGTMMGTGDAMNHDSDPLTVMAEGIVGGIGGKLTDVAFQKIAAPIVSAAIEKFGMPMFEKLASIIPDTYKTSFQTLADSISRATPSSDKKIPVVSDVFQKGRDFIDSIGEKASNASQDMRQKMLQSAYRDTVNKYQAPPRLLHNMETNMGTDPIGVLSAYGNGATIPEMSSGKINPNESIDFLKNQIGELSKIKTKAVEANNVGVPIDEYQASANKIISKQGWSKMRVTEAENQVAKTIEKMRETYPDGSIPLTELDTIKTEQTNLSKSYNNNGKDPFVYDAHGILGKSARKIVEDRTNDAPTRDLNKWIQSHYNAIDLLESLRGKAPHGGLLTQGLHRLGGEAVGAVTGAMAGHPWLGAMAGHFGADAIDGILGANFISNPIKRSLIESMQNADPAVVKTALKYLDEKSAQMETQLSLPPPQTKLPGPADLSGARSIPAGEVRDVNGNLLRYNSTGESMVDATTRKLPVKLEPSDYSDRIYTPTEKLPVIDMGKTPASKSDLPVIKYGSPLEKGQDLAPNSLRQSQRNTSPTTKTTNIIPTKDMPESIPYNSVKVKAGENPGQIKKAKEFSLPEKTKKPGAKTIIPAGVAVGASTIKGATTAPGTKNGSDVEPSVVKKIQTQIKHNESEGQSDQYGSSQPSGNKKDGDALGAYRVTESELKTYAPRFLGKSVTKGEFLSNPSLQDSYMKEKISSLLRRGLTSDEVLAVHRDGMSDLTKEGLKKKVEGRSGYVEAGKKATRSLNDLNKK